MSLRTIGLVVAVLLALVVGCEKDRAGGAVGATGGSGGDAGSGGSGGAGDGACDAPIDFWSVAEVTADREIVGVENMSFSGRTGAGAGTCGGGGEQLVFRVDPPGYGVLVLSFRNDAPPGTDPVLLLRWDCADSASELPIGGCVFDHRDVSVYSVTAAEPLFLIVDAGGATSFHFTLQAGFFPYRQVGETCDDAFASRTPCTPGLVCDDIASPGVCVPNEPPVVDGAELLRGGPDGSDLLVRVFGSDVNGNAGGAFADFYDDQGEPVIDSWGPARRALGGWDPGSLDLGGWMRNVSFFHFDEAMEKAAWADVRAIDTGHIVSMPFRAPIGTQHVAQLGERCDRDRVLDMCEPGLICVDEGGVCEKVAPLREAACAAAAPVEVGVPLPFAQAWPLLDPEFPPHLWEVPTASFSDRHKRSEFYRIDDLVTQVARLSLDRERTNLSIELDDTAGRDLVMMLYPGCGTSEPPVACMDDPQDSKSRQPSLKFPSLPAGEYLVVVRPVRPWVPIDSWTLVVTADP